MNLSIPEDNSIKLVRENSPESEEVDDVGGTDIDDASAETAEDNNDGKQEEEKNSIYEGLDENVVKKIRYDIAREFAEKEGWKEDGGDLSPEEFLHERGKHFSKNKKTRDKQSQEIKALNEQLERLQEMQTTIIKNQVSSTNAAIEEKIKQIEAQRKAAIESGDYNATRHYENERNKLYSQKQKEPQVLNKQPFTEEEYRLMAEWEDKNSDWYNRPTTIEDSDYTTNVFARINAEYKHLPMEERLEMLTEQVDPIVAKYRKNKKAADAYEDEDNEEYVPNSPSPPKKRKRTKKSGRVKATDLNDVARRIVERAVSQSSKYKNVQEYLDDVNVTPDMLK